jgi:hypothetical protein
MKKIKKTTEQLIDYFWIASDNCYFTDGTVALILCVERQTLAKYRCDNKGPKYSKLNGRVLYRKADVVQFLGNGDKS